MSRPARLLSGLRLFWTIWLFAAAGMSSAAPQHGADSSVPPPTTDTGWTSPEATPTSADSLPAFRPDSIRNETVRGVESGPTPLSAPRTARDSSDSVAALLRGRRPSLSVHGGFNLLDLDAMDVFQASLQVRIRRDSLAVLQPYEPVNIAVPVGLQVLWPLLPWFDAVARTHSYWYKQPAVLRYQRPAEAGQPLVEEFFAVQAHLGGAGLRYYVPPTLLSVAGKLGLYAQGVYYWLLGGTEIYTSHGSARAEFDPAGSAWEIQLGFNQVVTQPWTISGGLGYMQQHFRSASPWSDLLVDAPPPGKVEWGSAALQGFFQFNWHFGVVGPPANSATAPPPAK